MPEERCYRFDSEDGDASKRIFMSSFEFLCVLFWTPHSNLNDMEVQRKKPR